MEWVLVVTQKTKFSEISRKGGLSKWFSETRFFGLLRAPALPRAPVRVAVFYQPRIWGTMLMVSSQEANCFQGESLSHGRGGLGPVR
jgi:hypothetical protein